jgi:hypothetical protein
MDNSNETVSHSPHHKLPIVSHLVYVIHVLGHLPHKKVNEKKEEKYKNGGMK